MSVIANVTLIPTILCGGVGSRLWPVSREQHPKPFIRIDGGNSLLQKAFLRGASLPDVDHILTVTNRDLLFKIKDEYREIPHPPNKPIETRFILEPFARNTAPAIAAAALHVAEVYGDDAILLVLAADHLIENRYAFEQSVVEATQLATKGKLVTFGIRPTVPETGYGYIEANGHKVMRFVEKPSLGEAERYLASGNFLWNSGMFCFIAKTMLREMAHYCPKILEATRDCLNHSGTVSGKGFGELELDPERFEAVSDDSIDYAVMEKTRNAAVVACDIGWSDIGCWRALGDLEKSDENNNRIHGDAVVLDSRNCIVKSENRMVGVVGVENLVIVDTPDALLVADKRHTQEVRRIYARLEALGHEAHKLHRTVHRPWGTYTVLEKGPHFKIKRIELNLGASISLQMHYHRSEHWVVVSGVAKVINDARELILEVNESTYIPAEHKHRLENIGSERLVMIEVQTGNYLEEDDIVRFQDDHGRSTCPD
uniref:mannose-1-phosphate guanylyltransferase n=1 Tax=Candidatus Kentrum sp. TC TaxID=2126339 RepID=A0A450ZS28_9GAMM|nr:MAG: mannose-1-phosphate guanylyltransferase [Candidatus Kentron sp. TC]